MANALRPLALALVALLPALAGCASDAPADAAECVPLQLAPEDDEIRVGQAFLRVTVTVRNCSDEPITLHGGPCAADVMPRLVLDDREWVLREGAALRREQLTCDDPTRDTQQTIPAREAVQIVARWNGYILDETGRAQPAAPGVYTTRATVLNETVEGQVRVLG